MGKVKSCQSYSCPLLSAMAICKVMCPSLMRLPALMVAVYLMPLCGRMRSTMTEGEMKIFFRPVVSATTGTTPYAGKSPSLRISKMTLLCSPEEMT